MTRYNLYDNSNTLSVCQHTCNSLTHLTNCAIDISSTPLPIMDRPIRVLQREPRLFANRYDPSLANQQDKHIYAMTLHLMTYGRDLSIIVRKDFEPKPSSYLMYNPSVTSTIITPKDRSIVYDILKTDESNLQTITTPSYVPCPF